MQTILLSVILGAIGAYLLYRGATLLLDSATDLAKNLGVPIVVIGVTIIAFSTSLPELVVGVIAGIDGESDIVLGNILGSNMANLGLVLGLAALLRPVKVPLNDRFEILSMVFATTMLFALSGDGNLSRFDGVIMIAFGLLFTWIVLYRAKRSHVVEQAVERVVTIQHRQQRLWNGIAIIAAITLIFIGARMVVTNAVALARLFSVSDVLIGITLVAVGTSLPEIVATTIASARKDSSLVVGNIIGSNVLNIFVVLGITVLITPVTVNPTVWHYDLPVLLVATLVATRFIRKDRVVKRWEGIALLAGYTAYILFAFVARAGLPFGSPLGG